MTEQMNKQLCPKCYVVLILDPEEIGPYCPKCEEIKYETITEYTVHYVEMCKIWSDEDFNCRGTILPMDVVDLAKDIQQNGLQFPIAVQPIGEVDNAVFRGDEVGFDFRIIAGHRRFAAFKVLKKISIPVMVKVGLSEVQARLVNLGENLKRKALNILQEARAIERLRKLGLNRRQVAEELGVSTSWVQVRFNLLDLPSEIQEEAAAGILNQYQIKELFSLGTKEEQYEAVKQIKRAKLKGEKGISVGKKPQQDPFKKKRQPKNVVQEMIDHLGKNIGFGLHTRVLAWANGEISAAELYFDIKLYADEHGFSYQVPLTGAQ